MLVASEGFVFENKKTKPNGMFQQTDYNLLESKGPTNWEYGSWQPANNSLASWYAKNIAIVTISAKSADNPLGIFTLLAIKDTINGFYLAAEDDFLKKLSGKTIKLDFDFSGEEVYGS